MTTTFPTILEEDFALDRLIAALDRNDHNFGTKLRWLLAALTKKVSFVTISVIDMNLSPANGDPLSRPDFNTALWFIEQQLGKMEHYGGVRNPLSTMPIEIDVENDQLIWTAPGIHGHGVMYLVTPSFCHDSPMS